MQFFAQPYDLDATGFYFDSYEVYEAKNATNKNRYGMPVEEYEIQAIDGEDLEFALGNAVPVNQANIEAFFDIIDTWKDYELLPLCVAYRENIINTPLKAVTIRDIDEITIYCDVTMLDLVDQFIDEGLFGEIPERLENYLDKDAMARDLSYDYRETEVAGTSVIYRAD